MGIQAPNVQLSPPLTIKLKLNIFAKIENKLIWLRSMVFDRESYIQIKIRVNVSHFAIRDTFKRTCDSKKLNCKTKLPLKKL